MKRPHCLETETKGRERRKVMDVDDPVQVSSATYLQLNVGGVPRRVEQTLVGLAPPGSRARAFLTGSRLDNEICFVDEHPAHFDRLIDCLRHGTGALDCMSPYDAAVVISLLNTRATLTQTCATHMDRIGDGADSTCLHNSHSNPLQCDVVRLVVGSSAEPVDVAKSTLCSRATIKERSRRESPLALLVGDDARWRAPTVDGRLCIDQNPRHFAIVLDCQRHGVGLVAHLQSLYDLWGVRAIADYYQLDALFDAAQMALSRLRYDTEPNEKKRIILRVFDRQCFAFRGETLYPADDWFNRHDACVVRDSTAATWAEIAALAKAAMCAGSRRCRLSHGRIDAVVSSRSGSARASVFQPARADHPDGLCR
nr:BTB/POZ domain motif-containing [Pandoravirus massiliensis]